jgi:hypothetical protein
MSASPRAAGRAPSGRDLAIVAAFVLATGLCLWGAPWHIDEPFFLAIARQILRDPLHPLGFAFNWYDRSTPMATINNTPPMLGYLLAAALKVSGGGEFWTRALFFPFDLAAAWSLLALAARFLRRPLWPTLIVLAGPAWALNLHHVMAERVMAGFALPALWLAVVGADDGDARAWWGSAALCALALVSKYNALFVLPPALLYGWSRGVSRRRLALWLAVAVSLFAAYQAWDQLGGGDAARAARLVQDQVALQLWSRTSHKLRSLLAFTGGLGLVVSVWGFLLKPRRAAILAAAVAAGILFGPWLDLHSAVRVVDRATGFVFAWGLLVGLWVLGTGPRSRGTALWAAWASSVAALQLMYWSILARFVVFLLPPLTFWLWERLEAERPEALERCGRAGFGAALALGLALGAVDRRFADSQKEAVAQALALAQESGGRAWSSAHWGLQEYATEAGVGELDANRGGWRETRAGDVVIVPTANSNALKANVRFLADVSDVVVDSPIPLRLISGWTNEAGFYSSSMGFLPWSISREPVDKFVFVRRRAL